MSDRYEKHPTDGGKFQSLFDDYGHGEGEGKTPQAINTRFRKLAKASEESAAVAEVIESVDEVETSDEPVWLQVEEELEGDPDFETLSNPAKGFLRAVVDRGEAAPRTKDELKLWYRQQAKVVRFLFSGVVDPLVSAYGRGVMGDAGKDWRIERSADDWEVFEGVTEQWIEYHGFEFPVSPDLVMAGCLASYYAPPVVHIHRNRDPSKPSMWGKMKGRFLKWRARRKLKRMGVEEYE